MAVQEALDGFRGAEGAGVVGGSVQPDGAGERMEVFGGHGRRVGPFGGTGRLLWTYARCRPRWRPHRDLAGLSPSRRTRSLYLSAAT